VEAVRACAPQLLLLANAYAGVENRPGAIRLAAVVELLHSATLIHDDVIDSADTRRGPPLRNSRLGQSSQRPRRRLAVHAVLPDGARRTQFRILDILIDVTQKMVEGELIQLARLAVSTSTEETR